METKVKEEIEKSIVSKSDKPLAPLPQEEEDVAKAMSEIDIKDRNSIIYFGSLAQAKLDDISNRMLEGVKTQETGEAGEVLNSMVATIRGFDIDSLDPNKKIGWFEKLLGKSKPLEKFISKYEEVRDQIDLIANNLERHKAQLIKDIIALDKLYDANLDYFRKLELYITAGEQKLKELDENIIPEYEQKAKSQDMLDIQNLKEIRAFRDDLERRVHDLRLSRQVAMQALPSIRLIQENDKSLINKITSTLVNTLPLWKNQLAQTITIFRSHDAAKSIKEASNLTNELLERNAQGLREANKEVREQMERGIFDIESVKRANKTLIDTLNDSLKIAQEGKEARAKAVVELQKTEQELKEALLSVKAKSEEPKKIDNKTHIDTELIENKE